MKRKHTLISVYLAAALMLCACAAGGNTAANAGSSAHVQGAGSPDQLYSDDEKNVDLIVFCCDGTYYSCERGSDRWLSVLGDTPWNLKLKDGEYAYVNADITRVSGGFAGYAGNPYIKKAHSVKRTDLKELSDNGDIAYYDPAEGTVYGLRIVSAGDRIYCLAVLQGEYHVYSEFTHIGSFDSAFEAETAAGLHPDADSTLDYKRVIVGRLYIFRCGDEYLAYGNSMDLNNNGLWKVLLNEELENSPADLSIEDGETVLVTNGEVYAVSGGIYADEPMLAGDPDYEPCSYGTITLGTTVEHWEEAYSAYEGELRQFGGGNILIFFRGGKYRIYREDGSDHTLLGVCDTTQEVNELLGWGNAQP